MLLTALDQPGLYAAEVVLHPCVDSCCLAACCGWRGWSVCLCGSSYLSDGAVQMGCGGRAALAWKLLADDADGCDTVGSALFSLAGDAWIRQGAAFWRETAMEQPAGGHMEANIGGARSSGDDFCQVARGNIFNRWVVYGGSVPVFMFSSLTPHFCPPRVPLPPSHVPSP